MSVGSPPCQAIMTSGVRCDSWSWRTYSSSVSSVMRGLASGYSPSFSRKKQYAQSRLHAEPVGLASRWNDGGRPAGSGLSA